MIWLLVPIFSFLCILAIIIYRASTEYRQRNWTGKTSDIDIICHCFMGSGFQTGALYMSSEKSEDIIFVNLAEPSPSFQILRKCDEDWGGENLRGQHEGAARPVVAEVFDVETVPPSSAEVAETLKGIFRQRFGTTEKTKPEFSIYGHRKDVYWLGALMQGQTEPEQVHAQEPPYANYSEEVVRELREESIIDWASALVGPVPFVLSYYLWGLWAGAIAVAVMPVLWTVLHYVRKGSLGKNWFRTLNWFFIPAMAGVTVLTGDPWYLLKSLSFNCLLLVAAIVWFWLRGSSASVKLMHYNSPPSRAALFNVATDVCFIFVALGAAYINERLSSGADLEFWVWYFAYFRIELMIGLIVAMMPIIVGDILSDQEKDTEKGL